VLVSIQSLIMVPQPYYNEPGHGEPQEPPRAESAGYNERIREHTLRFAMLDHLRRGRTDELTEVLRAHFRMRRNAIVAQCMQWLAASSPARREELAALVEELQQELAKL